MEIILDIIDSTVEGQGIGKNEGRVYFIEGAVPGDRICVKNIHENLAVGDELELSGPYGQFFVRRSDTQDVIFIAGGSGLSSPQSMILDLLAEIDTNSNHDFADILNSFLYFGSSVFQFVGTIGLLIFIWVMYFTKPSRERIKARIWLCCKCHAQIQQ